ncbi:MAG: MSHA biogenesis protein MshK [Burkholderiales bacterium]
MTNVNLPLYILAAVGLLLCHGSGTAQSINDPTRPPGAVPSADTEPEQARAPVLQSVLITPTHRAAIINGQRVELGGRYGEARVLKITETEVVLRSVTGTEVLKMYPNVDKALKGAEPAQTRPTARGRSSKG